MGYKIKPEKKVHTANWNKENFLDKEGRINYIGKINATLSRTAQVTKRIRRARDIHDNPFIGKKYNQIRKQFSLITGTPYISHWLRKENRREN